MKIQIKGLELETRSVDLEGDLDFHTSPELRRELTKQMGEEVRQVMVDLQKVPYIDSSGLATFVELFQKIRRRKGRLILFNLCQGVRSVFEIAKLDTLFQLAKNEEEALLLVST